MLEEWDLSSTAPLHIDILPLLPPSLKNLYLIYPPTSRNLVSKPLEVCNTLPVALASVYISWGAIEDLSQRELEVLYSDKCPAAVVLSNLQVRGKPTESIRNFEPREGSQLRHLQLFHPRIEVWDREGSEQLAEWLPKLPTSIETFEIVTLRDLDFFRKTLYLDKLVNLTRLSMPSEWLSQAVLPCVNAEDYPLRFALINPIEQFKLAHTRFGSWACLVGAL